MQCKFDENQNKQTEVWGVCQLKYGVYTWLGAFRNVVVYPLIKITLKLQLKNLI